LESLSSAKREVEQSIEAAEANVRWMDKGSILQNPVSAEKLSGIFLSCLLPSSKDQRLNLFNSNGLNMYWLSFLLNAVNSIFINLQLILFVLSLNFGRNGFIKSTQELRGRARVAGEGQQASPMNPFPPIPVGVALRQRIHLRNKRSGFKSRQGVSFVGKHAAVYN
jgi:hypothetical protein